MAKKPHKRQLTDLEIEVYIRYYRKEITADEAYLIIHPTAQRSTALSHGSEMIDDIGDRLPDEMLAKIYRLGRERIYQEVDRHLKATKPLTYKGFKTGEEEPDNQTRSAALKILCQLNGVGDRRTEISAEGGDSVHIIIDN